MAVTYKPIFVQGGNMLPVALTNTANAASDGSGTLTTVFTAQANGSRVDAIRFRNAQTTPAASSNNVFRIFVTDAAGANPLLVGEVTMAAVTRSATVAGATAVFTPDVPIILKSGQLIKVAQHASGGAQDLTHCFVSGGDY